MFLNNLLKNFVYTFDRRYLIIEKKNSSENVSTQKYDFERRLCAQTQGLQFFKKFYISQMNPKDFFHKTAYSVQLPYKPGLSLYKNPNLL